MKSKTYVKREDILSIEVRPKERNFDCYYEKGYSSFFGLISKEPGVYMYSSMIHSSPIRLNDNDLEDEDSYLENGVVYYKPHVKLYGSKKTYEAFFDSVEELDKWVKEFIGQGNWVD